MSRCGSPSLVSADLHSGHHTLGGRSAGDSEDARAGEDGVADMLPIIPIAREHDMSS